MANYTITRVTDVNDVYGCTNFQTTETETEIAMEGGGPNSVDGDIVWLLDADIGYTVSLPFFSIPSATQTTVGASEVFIGGSIPAPILGVVMDQISITRIRITIYLVPDSSGFGITGTTFNMPSGNISVQLPIYGCAEKNNTGL